MPLALYCYFWYECICSCTLLVAMRVRGKAIDTEGKEGSIVTMMERVTQPTAKTLSVSGLLSAHHYPPP